MRGLANLSAFKWTLNFLVRWTLQL